MIRGDNTFVIKHATGFSENWRKDLPTGDETLFHIRQEPLRALEWLKRDGIVRDLSVRVFTAESQLILDISLESSTRMKVL